MLKIDQEQGPAKTETRVKKDSMLYLKKFYSWFCGVESGEDTDRDIETTIEIIEAKITSIELLKQTKKQKII